MPPSNKKRQRNKINLKQKKLLKVRLIKISMVIEDYLYKNKPVTTTEARAYVEEVSNYKQQCLDDARSLQVIEKITRCMNSMIAEQQENHASCIDFQQVSENYCPSPVYSIAEEDRTVLDQAPIMDHLNQNREVEKDNEIETIDLCDDENENVMNIDVDVEIHRAMSNLSIRENTLDTNNHKSNTIDCSQSILKNFNENRLAEINNVAIKTPEQTMGKCIEHEFDNDCSQSDLAILTQNKKTIMKDGLREASIEPNKVPKIPKENAKYKNKDLKSKISIKNVKYCDEIKTICLFEDNENKHYQKRNNKNKKQKDNTNSTLKEKTKRKKKNANSNREVTEIPVNYFSKTIDKCASTDTNISKNEAACKKAPSPDICLLSKENKPIYSKSMAKIYNTNIENDLSWVENIRYVREISTEECDYRSLADNFWENYAFPNDWNEKEFD